MLIETERLIITEFTMDMAQAVQENSIDEDNRRFVPDEVWETVEEAAETLKFLISQYGSLEGPLVYPIIVKATNANVGYLQLCPIEDGMWEIGYHIAKKYTGNGYATEALKAFLPVIAKQAGVSEIYGICLAENKASRAVLQKCGFKNVFTGIGEYQGADREIIKYVWRICGNSNDHSLHKCEGETKMLIRNEKPEDYRTVEEMIKRTFWNLSVPGCNEHYFAHQVRKSKDYIPELDFVLESEGKIIGHILYVKAKLLAEDGTEKEILSFGPFTIDPEYQRQGYGRKLLDYSLTAARKMGYSAVAIFGNPENYACYGFKNCKRYDVCLEKDIYPVALLVKEIEEGALSGKKWKYVESPAHNMDESGFEDFDRTFPQMEKGYQYTQELFYIYSRSNVLR